MARSLVITIDGPAGSGKSSVASLVAKRLEIKFLDTGAMYRAATAAAMDRIGELDDCEQLCEIIQTTDFDFKFENGSMRVFVSGEDMTSRIRTAEVTVNVKHIASCPQARELLVEMQRDFARHNPRLVTEGRDQGTVVFPDADYKFFLEADVAERARRRREQLLAGGSDIEFAALIEQIKQRDRSDRTRKVGPLKSAENAVIIDTTDLSLEQVVEKIVNSVRPGDATKQE
jgi:cytidylate kinase